VCCYHTRCCSQLSIDWQRTHAARQRDWATAWVALQTTLRSLQRPTLLQRVRSETPLIRRCWCRRDVQHTRGARPWLVEWERSPDERSCRAEGWKHLPAVVVMRGRGIRCAWPVDAACGAPAAAGGNELLDDWHGGASGGVWAGLSMVVCGYVGCMYMGVSLIASSHNTNRGVAM
jgi:hypothetical protein